MDELREFARRLREALGDEPEPWLRLVTVVDELRRTPSPADSVPDLDELLKRAADVPPAGTGPDADHPAVLAALMVAAGRSARARLLPLVGAGQRKELAQAADSPAADGLAEDLLAEGDPEQLRLLARRRYLDPAIADRLAELPDPAIAEALLEAAGTPRALRRAARAAGAGPGLCPPAGRRAHTYTTGCHGVLPALLHARDPRLIAAALERRELKYTLAEQLTAVLGLIGAGAADRVPGLIDRGVLGRSAGACAASALAASDPAAVVRARLDKELTTRRLVKRAREVGGSTVALTRLTLLDWRVDRAELAAAHRERPFMGWPELLRYLEEPGASDDPGVLFGRLRGLPEDALGPMGWFDDAGAAHAADAFLSGIGADRLTGAQLVEEVREAATVLAWLDRLVASGRGRRSAAVLETARRVRASAAGPAAWRWDAGLTVAEVLAGP
ncbi:hypothetical protein [Mangrovactinospora gilvigrisea]|uniref:hypothetical protein n=1 Tax=Mangrovactinospora gilvigrisea TaxID=1428644 RepID=UPI0015879BD6|nr:hypothetical protein [Mangrovactinospora gilvigrisea]